MHFNVRLCQMPCTEGLVWESAVENLNKVCVLQNSKKKLHQVTNSLKTYAILVWKEAFISAVKGDMLYPSKLWCLLIFVYKDFKCMIVVI